MPGQTREDPQAAFLSCLIACSTDRDDPSVLALAGALVSLPRADDKTLPLLPRLDQDQMSRLLARWFPKAAATGFSLTQAMSDQAPRLDELDDLVSLFNAHADIRVGSYEEANWIATALAVGCLGTDHLWQDLRLPSRRVLSEVINLWFPALAARNVRDMKWKKFFYKQLCEREEIFACRAPSCDVCHDYQICFGPEE